MRKIPTRFAPVIFALLMSCVMVFVMSGFITAVNTGIDSAFVKRWSLSFVSAWPVAFVCVLLFAGRVRKVVGRICVPL